MRSGKRRRTRNSRSDVFPLRGIMYDAEYPASSVLPAHPPSAQASPLPRGRTVASTECLSATHLPQTSLVAYKTCSVRAVTTTPAGRSVALLARFPDRSGLPSYYGQSAPALAFSRPARCSLSLRPARFAALLTEGVSWSISDHLLPPGPPQVLPAGAREAGWTSHPLISYAFPRHTQQ